MLCAHIAPTTPLGSPVQQSNPAIHQIHSLALGPNRQAGACHYIAVTQEANRRPITVNTGFSFKAVRVGFMLDKVAIEQVSRR
jgi:hypothetical protein